MLSLFILYLSFYGVALKLLFTLEFLLINKKTNLLVSNIMFFIIMNGLLLYGVFIFKMGLYFFKFITVRSSDTLCIRHSFIRYK